MSTITRKKINSGGLQRIWFFNQSTISRILWDESFTTLKISSDKALKYYELLNNPSLISWIELYLEDVLRVITASNLRDHINEELGLSVSLSLIRKLLIFIFKMSYKKASSHPLELNKTCMDKGPFYFEGNQVSPKNLNDTECGWHLIDKIVKKMFLDIKRKIEMECNSKFIGIISLIVTISTYRWLFTASYSESVNELAISKYLESLANYLQRNTSWKI